MFVWLSFVRYYAYNNYFRWQKHISCHVVYILTCDVMSCHVTSCHSMSFHMICQVCRLMRNALSCLHVLQCHVMSYNVSATRHHATPLPSPSCSSRRRSNNTGVAPTTRSRRPSSGGFRNQAHVQRACKATDPTRLTGQKRDGRPRLANVPEKGWLSLPGQQAKLDVPAPTRPPTPDHSRQATHRV
jgi:hypothetical protein